MAIQAGVGISTEADARHAGYEACTKAFERAGIEHADLVIAFSSVSFDQQQMIDGIREASNNVPVIGCSGAGEITNQGPRDEEVAVMAIQADTIRFTLGAGKEVQTGAREAGQAAARAVRDVAPEDLRAFILFTDVLTGNGAETLRGVQDVLGEHMVIFGGAAGDDFKLEKTYQYAGKKVLSSSTAGLGLSGTFAFGAGVRHGWTPISAQKTVTKSEGATIYEIDGEPAIRIYEEYFGMTEDELRRQSFAKIAGVYPLGLKVEGFDEYLIRTPMGLGEGGSITTAAEVPEGTIVHVMIGSKEKAIEASRGAAEKLMADFEKQSAKPKFVLTFNCIARKQLFGGEVKREIDTIQEVIGRDVPLLGLYTYGEIAPIEGEVLNEERRQSQFYNETVALFGIGE